MKFWWYNWIKDHCSVHHDSKVQSGLVKPRSVGSRDQNRGLNGPWLNFTHLLNHFASIPLLCFTLYLRYQYFFKGLPIQTSLKTYISWISHSCQASSHQYLQITFIFFHFFLNFCWTMTAILPLVPKYSSRGHHLWEHFEHPHSYVTLFSVCECNLVPVRLYSYILPCLFAMCDRSLKPIAKTFENESSHRGSIMPPQLNPNRKVMIWGITGPDCSIFGHEVLLTFDLRMFKLNYWNFFQITFLETNLIKFNTESSACRLTQCV